MHNLSKQGEDYFKATGFYDNYQNPNQTKEPKQNILSSYSEDIPTAFRWRDKYSACIACVESSGKHNHSLSINSTGSHTHSVSINNGQANLSNPTNARHGSETRVKNLALIYCIKY